MGSKVAGQDKKAMGIEGVTQDGIGLSGSGSRRNGCEGIVEEGNR